MSEQLIVKFEAPIFAGERDNRSLWGFAVLATFFLLALGWWGVPLMLAAHAALGVVAVRYFRQRIEIDQFGVTVVRIRSERRIPMAEVLYVKADEFVRFIGDRDRDLGGLLVGWEGRNAVTRHLQRHLPEVPVNPVEPWLDRHGRWHSELHRADPLESIRSIRRAVVGRWAIEVKVHDRARFQAIAHTCGGAPGLWAGDEHTTLAAATDDAVRMIRELRHGE